MVKIDYRPYLSLGSATALSQLFLLAVSPIATRLYSQEEFGAAGLVVGAGALLSALAAGRLELAIPAARTALSAVRRFWLGVVFVAAMTVLAALAIAVMRSFDLVTSEIWKPLPLFLIPLVGLALALQQLGGALLLWHRDYRSFGLSKVSQGFTTAALQIGFGLGIAGTIGLVLAQFLGYLASAAVGMRKLLPLALAELSVRHAATKNTLLENWRYPAIMGPAALFNQASQQLPLLAISHGFGLFEAGLFALTYRICASPLGLAGRTVAQVYASQFRGVAEAGGGALQVHLLALVRRLLLAGLAAVAALVIVLLLADRINLFGQGWSRIGEIALYLSPLLLMDFVVSPLSTTLAYVERQRLQLAWDIGRFLALAATFVLASYYKLSFEWTIIFFALVWALGQILHFTLSYRASRAVGGGSSTENPL